MAENLTDRLEDLQVRAKSNSAISEREKESYNTGIHKLFPELLLHIFQLGEEIARGTRTRDRYYLAIQDIVTQVCSRWRHIAISCPLLWTHIHVTRPAPHHLASLYLSRAGLSTLFDVNIEIRNGWYGDLDIRYDYVGCRCEQVTELLKFLTSHGAPVSRWKTLSVCAPEMDMLLKCTSIISVEAAPALRFLTCKLAHDGRELQAWGRCLHGRHSGDAFKYTPFVKWDMRFDRLTWSCTFDPRSPACSGITELRFTSWPTECSPSRLRKMLQLNPQLERLSLGSSEIYRYQSINHIEPFTNHENIRMMRLHTLEVGTIQDLYWVLGVIHMIDAPVLRRLSVTSFVCTEKNEDQNPNFCRLFISDDDGEPTLGMPIYPSLQELDIHNFFHRAHIVDMFTRWPSITKLHANRAQVELLEDSLLLPQLSYLKIHFKPHPQLGRILSSREATGLPIRVLVLVGNGWQEDVEAGLPRGITVREHDAFDYEIDSDDTIEEGSSFDDHSEMETTYWTDDEYVSDETGSDESEWMWRV